MAAWEDCLAAAVKEGKISEKTANDYKKYFADAEKEAAQLGKAGVDAYTFATSTAAERMMAKVGAKKANVAADILRMDRAMEDVQGHSKGVFRGLQAKLGENVRGGGVKDSLVGQQRAAYGAMQSQLTGFIEQLRSRLFGLTRDRAPAKDAVLELYGRDSKVPSAKTNAEGWRKVLDWWAQMMDNEKVTISKREDFFLPQQFNALKVRVLGQDGFTQAMMERWQDGRLKMRDFKSTGDVFLEPGKDDARVRAILEGEGKKPGAWTNITSHGEAAIEPGVFEHETMAERYNRRRVFEWTTPEAYFDFQETFGHGADSLGEQFMKHLHQMARDLGTARVLGGDPDRMAKTLIQWGQKQQVGKYDTHLLEATYFHASGKAQEAQSVTLANTAQAIRSWLSSVQLGGAALGSLPDFAFLKSTATFNGLDPVRMMGHYLSEMKGDKRQAMQLGLIVDGGLRGLRDHFDEVLAENAGQLGKGMSLGDAAEAASAGAARLAGRASEFVMRGTGLEHHSTSGRNALGKAMLAHLADDAGLAFDALPKARQAFLERYGIGAKDWDMLRTKAMQGEKLFMDPAWLAFNGSQPEREVALRLMAGVDAELRFGIPEGGIATRAFMLGMTQPGTMSGEARRAVQYKGFTLSVTMMHGWRAFDQMFDKNGSMPRGQYLAGLGVMATVLGAVSYQLKNIAAGKDPESMDTAAFWLKAAAMGGAGGMFGDQVKTMLQTTSRADGVRMLSPTAGLAVDTMALVPGNIGQWARGEKTSEGREAVAFARKYSMPRLWYTNLAVDRLVWDTLQKMADPESSGAFYRTEQRSRKQDDVNFWWRPGQSAPSRGPDLENAVKSKGLVKALSMGAVE